MIRIEVNVNHTDISQSLVEIIACNREPNTKFIIMTNPVYDALKQQNRRITRNPTCGNFLEFMGLKIALVPIIENKQPDWIQIL